MDIERVQITEEKLLSDNWYVLKRYTFNYLGKNGQWTTQQREAYDRGNGATILLHNPQTDTIILTRQFRLPGSEFVTTVMRLWRMKGHSRNTVLPQSMKITSPS